MEPQPDNNQVPQPVTTQPPVLEGAPFQPPHPAQHEPTNASLIVLQWLTYAFWGWTVLGMSVLISTVLANVIADGDTGAFTPYGIAAVLVLLPISIVCDVLYTKKEPKKFSGPASLVMVVHAVIFAIFGIGSLISTVIAIVSLITSSTNRDASQVWLYSSMIIFVLYAVLFLRTISLPRLRFLRRWFVLFMAVVVGIIAIFGIIGPAAQERTRRNDKLITSNLSNLQYAVNGYASSHDKLPASLRDLKLSGDTQQLVDKNLVEYTANVKAPGTIKSSYYSSSYGGSDKIYYYEFCVTFTKKDKSRNYRSSYDQGEYTSYLSTYGHEAGRECYKLQTSDY